MKEAFWVDNLSLINDDPTLLMPIWVASVRSFYLNKTEYRVDQKYKIVFEYTHSTIVPDKLFEDI